MATDIFFSSDKQPKCGFISKLKAPLLREKPEWFKRLPEANEADLRGAYIAEHEHIDELETAIDELSSFLEIYDSSSKRSFPIVLQRAETEVFEAFSIEVSHKECVILAGDSEGFRRAIYFLEDEFLRREGMILPLGKISRAPKLKTRITRSFFAPINRPPLNIDELMTDEDYYPDEYLSRLAHDGANGIWIYTRLPDLVKTSVFPEFGENSERRIAKLSALTDRALRYGIKTYVFFIEPKALPPELAEKYPEACASDKASWNGEHQLCAYSREVEEYCIEAISTLLRLIPRLGGFIDITMGERPTSCVSGAECFCSRDNECKKDKAAILAHVVELMKEGIRRAGSEAEFISWTYGHRVWDHASIRKYIAELPDDAVAMENFADMGIADQLGRDRLAIDYWLSYIGPSKMFTEAAEQARFSKKQLYAKLQVCSSHELATLPYITAPGLLFEKYSRAIELGVTGVMQCWYFGNYPSLMSKAAGELSFLSNETREGFLESLAGIYVGKSEAKALARAWELIAEGYSEYPVNIMFSYYGPMHDGVVWELSLLPKNLPLPRTWKLEDAPNGDRIGECLLCGHTLDEAIALCSSMAEKIQSGIELFPERTPREQQTCANALAVLTKSGTDILRFYKLRASLGKCEGDPNITLDELEQIVVAEIENSRRMYELCIEDDRLGYHSEAEGYKFFPEKLLWRIERLEELLATEFPEVRRRISDGLAPLEYYLGEDELKLAKSSSEAVPIRVGGASICGWYDDRTVTLKFSGRADQSYMLDFEFELFMLSGRVMLRGGSYFVEGEREVLRDQPPYAGVFGDRIAELRAHYALEYSDGEYILRLDRALCGIDSERPFKLRICTDGCLWKSESEPTHTLGKPELSPGEFGWVGFED